MKALIIHTKDFHIKSIKKSTRPNDIISVLNHRKKIKLKFAVVVFITVEKGDDDLGIKKMISELLGIYHQIKSSKKVISMAIIPFAHLSRNLENPKLAYKKIDILFERIQDIEPNIKIILGDFGFNNEWGLEAYSHPISCVFRET